MYVIKAATICASISMSLCVLKLARALHHISSAQDASVERTGCISGECSHEYHQGKGKGREMWQCVGRALGYAEVERRGEVQGSEEGGRGKAAGCSVSPLSPFLLSASGHDEKAPLSVRRAGGRLPRAR